MNDAWPTLALADWQDTYATLHRWSQIVGKVRLARTPWINHSWHVTLYVTARGLTTSPIPYGTRSFEIDFHWSSFSRVRSLLMFKLHGNIHGFSFTSDGNSCGGHGILHRRDHVHIVQREFSTIDGNQCVPGLHANRVRRDNHARRVDAQR